MAVKIRLARHGRKKRPYYYIVVADVRAPRDGRFIERIGSFNPNTNPSTIQLDFDKALDWVMKGAEPTDTCRTILSREGVLMKKHLLEGVKKGAFDEAEAENRFDAWMKENDNKLMARIETIKSTSDADKKSRFDAETKVKETRAQAIASKYAEITATEKAEDDAKAEEEASKENAETAEETTPEVKEEVKEEAAPEAKEEVKEETVPEAKEEVKEEATPEVKEEKKEEAKTEAPAEEKENKEEK